MDVVPKDSNSDAEATVPITKYFVQPGKAFPPTPGDKEDWTVAFSPDDPERPINLPMWRRVVVKGIASINITFVVWGSSVIGPGLDQICELFHIGKTVSILTVTLYVLGFACGPVVWGPGSELYGRKPMLMIGMFGFMVFSFACAVAKDFQTLAISRFFMGAFGCTTLVVGPSISADLFTVTQRGKAVSGVIFCLVAGPMIAPVVGAFIANSYLGWRWTMYITGIMGALGLVIMLFCLEESYPQLVLKQRAVAIRKETGNWAVSAPLESMELDTKEILNRTILKPVRLAAQEPILLFFSIYQGFIYGILYLCLEAVPYVFGEDYGFKGSIIYLPYIGMFVGSIIVVCVNLTCFDPMTASLIAKSGQAVYPESRVPLMMLCGIIFPMGLFMFTWSGAYTVHWMVPTVGLGLVGFGLIGIFQSVLIYIIDTYLPVAATALAANTFIRSAMAGAFPLFAIQMFRNLGTQWAGTLLGCLAAIAAPVPFMFFFWGPAIRKKSKFALGEDNQDKKDLEREMTADPGSRTTMPSEQDW